MRDLGADDASPSKGKLSASASGPTPSPRALAPEYQSLRQNEIWPDGLSDDLFAPLKHVKLNDDGSVWVSFGGQIRERFETWNRFALSTPATADSNDAFLLNRALLHADLHVGSHVRAFVEGKSATATDRSLAGGLRTSDVDVAELQSAFLEFRTPVTESASLTFRVGRQEIAYGKNRILAPGDWNNTRKAFDGFSGTLKLGSWSATGMWLRPVVVQKYLVNRSDPHTNLFGVYASGTTPIRGLSADLYWLENNKPGASYNGVKGYERRQTVGGRLFGKLAKTGFDYELEGAYQFGSVGSSTISAYLLGSQVGYSLRGAPAKPRVYAGYEFGSGDPKQSGKVGGFSPLYGDSHPFYGSEDVIGRTNTVDPYVGVSFAPLKRLSLSIDEHNFWRADAHDALYDKTLKVLRPAQAKDSRFVGNELDLNAKYQANRHLVLFLGLSEFFSGAYVQQTGSGLTERFGYTGMSFTF